MSLRERNIAIKVFVREGTKFPSIMEFDWEVYACILWNQLSSNLQDKNVKIIFIELSLMDVSCEKTSGNFGSVEESVTDSLTYGQRTLNSNVTYQNNNYKE